jgi:hypothetical protein
MMARQTKFVGPFLLNQDAQVSILRVRLSCAGKHLPHDRFDTLPQALVRDSKGKVTLAFLIPYWPPLVALVKYSFLQTSQEYNHT